MNEKKYRISFSGDVIEGWDPARVKENFQTILRFDEKTIERLFSGRTVTLKKQADYKTALKFRNSFKKAGAVCIVREIRSTGPRAGKTAPGEPGRVEEKKRARKIACPKCGFEQEASEECRRCGIVFKKIAGAPARTAPPIRAVESERAGFGEIDSIKIKNGVTIALIISLVALLGSFFMKDRLPDPDPGVRGLCRPPAQTKTEKEPFFVTTGDVRYRIEPLFDYDLYGLVVTYYDSTGWWDIHHKFLWRDFLNVKDICVVYSLNAVSGVYKDMSWKSGTWTCHFKPKRKLRGHFSPSCVSNNHLLASDKSVQEEIMNAEKGDIIHLRGWLAKYSHKNGSRSSSTTRFDSGDGACETIFVEEFNILKKSNRPWRVLFTISTWLVAGCLIAIIVIYIKEMRRLPERYDTGEHESDPTVDPGSHTVPSLKFGARAAIKYKMKIVIQLIVLIVLLYLWATLH